jgi:hypothetical protein
LFNQRVMDGISTRSPEPLRNVFQFILSIAFSIGQHRQKSRTRFPGDFAIRIEVPHGVAAFLVLVQNLSDQLPFGQFRMIEFNVLIGDIHPESQGPVHSEFHWWSRRQERVESAFVLAMLAIKMG